MNDMSDLLTIGEVCKRLDISEKTYRRMIEAGEFPKPIRRNKRWVRIPVTDVIAYKNKLLESRQVQTA